MSKAEGQGGYMATTENVMQLFRESEDPCLTSTEVADEFEISQQAAYEKLSSLNDEGELDRKKVGARGVVWYLPKDYSHSAINPSR